MENSARLCRTITDRYDLGTLYQECLALEIEPGHEDDAELADFKAAMQTAAEIMEAPGNYMAYQFKEAIENLSAAYQTAKDYATGIKEIKNEDLRSFDSTIFNLAGQKCTGGNLPKGIYIINGKKIVK
jgi:hypothetical protein